MAKCTYCGRKSSSLSKTGTHMGDVINVCSSCEDEYSVVTSKTSSVKTLIYFTVSCFFVLAGLYGLSQIF